jgi:hypothetical protein
LSIFLFKMFYSWWRHICIYKCLIMNGCMTFKIRYCIHTTVSKHFFQCISGLTLEGDSGEEVALWWMVDFAFSLVKSEVQFAL